MNKNTITAAKVIWYTAISMLIIGGLGLAVSTIVFFAHDAFGLGPFAFALFLFFALPLLAIGSVLHAIAKVFRARTPR